MVDIPRSIVGVCEIEALVSGEKRGGPSSSARFRITGCVFCATMGPLEPVGGKDLCEANCAATVTSHAKNKMHARKARPHLRINPGTKNCWTIRSNF